MWNWLAEITQPAEHAEQIGEHREQRQREGGRDHARQHQLLDRVRAQRADRVDLLGHLHGAQLGRDAGAHAPADHQRGEHRRQLAREREADDAAHVGLGAEARQRKAGLQRQHHAREERRDQHDGGGTRPDRLQLAQRLERGEAAPAERALRSPPPAARSGRTRRRGPAPARRAGLSPPCASRPRRSRRSARGVDARPARSCSTHASKARWAGSGSPAATTRKSYAQPAVTSVTVWIRTVLPSSRASKVCVQPERPATRNGPAWRSVRSGIPIIRCRAMIAGEATGRPQRACRLIVSDLALAEGEIRALQIEPLPAGAGLPDPKALSRAAPSRRAPRPDRAHTPGSSSVSPSASRQAQRAASRRRATRWRSRSEPSERSHEEPETAHRAAKLPQPSCRRARRRRLDAPAPAGYFRGVSASHPLVLASASPRRRELLASAGVRFEVTPSEPSGARAARGGAGAARAPARLREGRRRRPEPGAGAGPLGARRGHHRRDRRRGARQARRRRARARPAPPAGRSAPPRRHRRWRWSPATRSRSDTPWWRAP